MVGSNQSPILGAVLENGRRGEVAFCELGFGYGNWVVSGRKGFEAIDSQSNRAVKLEIFLNIIVVVELGVPEMKL